MKNAHVMMGMAFEGDQQSSDYTADVAVYNRGGTAWSVLGAFLTGASFYTIPSSSTDNYIVQVKLADKSDEIVGEVANEDAIKTWSGVWFLVSSGDAQEAFDQTVNNQIRAALKELVEKGTFK